ncbi:MAG: GTPase, partial [Candidatus Diapherotrites archaeon]|nr:GTPase [Candidatus Diapherotrites archaeon]
HEIEKQSEQKSKRGSGESLAVKKEGAGQIVVIGLPNSGKSTALHALTGVDVEISDYPFTTIKPEIGMMAFAGTKIQFVEIPALMSGSADGKANGPQLLSLIRTADAVVVVLDGESAVDEFNTLQTELTKAGIFLNRHRPRIMIKPTNTKNISIAGKQYLKMPYDEFLAFLRDNGYPHCDVIIEEDLYDLKQVFEALDERLVYKKALCLLNFKGTTIQPVDGIKFKTVSFSNPSELLAFKPDLFALLEKILVYTKRPGQKASLESPLVLKQGSTIVEFASNLHKDFAQNLKHAKLFGPNAKFEGQRIQQEYVLQNNDIIEIQA